MSASNFVMVFTPRSRKSYVSARQYDTNLSLIMENDMSGKSARDSAESLFGAKPGDVLGVSPWTLVSQDLVTGFGRDTLDDDPLHNDPAWAKANSPYGGTIAYGFFTVSLLTHLFNSAMHREHDRDPKGVGYYLNYGFDRLRLVEPVPVGARVRGHFTLMDVWFDERGRRLSKLGVRVDIENNPKPALVAEWLSIWIPGGD